MAAYADLSDLETYLDQAAPDAPSEAVATRMLLRASEVIQEATMTAWYPTDVNGMPTDPDTIAAFRDATCAQVEFWFAGDEEDDILGPVDSLSLGGMTTKFSQGNARLTPMFIAPRAARILRNALVYRMEPRVL